MVLSVALFACKGPDKVSNENNVDYVPIATSSTSKVSSFEGTQWKLVEVFGKSVTEYGQLNKEPIFIFDAEAKRVSGNAGCNNMSASYELLEGGRIQFGPAISTKMACPNMELEDQVGQLLSTLDTYIINDAGELVLTRSRMAPLMRFVAVQ